MNESPIAKVAPDAYAGVPLFAQLFDRYGFADVRIDGFASFIAAPGHVLLVFLEDPLRYKEVLDLAVIVPELAKAFAGRFRVGVLLPEAARDTHVRYGFRRWPALVMLRGGEYVGAIDGLRPWNDYLEEMSRLLDTQPSRPPSIGIAVKGPSSGSGCAPG